MGDDILKNFSPAERYFILNYVEKSGNTFMGCMENDNELVFKDTLSGHMEFVYMPEDPELALDMDVLHQNEFHTRTFRVQNVEIKFIAHEDFVECGSIAGLQYFSAVQFGKLYRSNSFSPVLFENEREFLEKSILSFCDKHKFDITDKYSHHKGAEIELYKLNGWSDFTALVVTIHNDYTNVWVTIEEVSFQTYYSDHDRPRFTGSASVILEYLEKAKQYERIYPKGE